MRSGQKFAYASHRIAGSILTLKNYKLHAWTGEIRRNRISLYQNGSRLGGEKKKKKSK